MALSIKTSRILLPSATRSASTATLAQVDTDAAALRLYLDVSAVSGTGGLLPIVRGYDRISGNCVELTTGGGLPVTQVGTYAFEMTYYPSDAFGNIREAVSRAVPYHWDVIVKHADGSNYTYSLSTELLK
jgi:hypothetical protein